MKTVILCGGKGTRIRGVDDRIPKPMIPIGKHPILWHIMNHYAFYGYNDFVLCLGYLGWVIKSYFLNFKAMMSDFTIDFSKQADVYFNNDNSSLDWKITLAETGENAQTGARIRKIRRYVKDEDYFMLTYGDGLSNINIKELIKFHTSHEKIITVTGVRPSSRFGEIEVSASNQVLEFHEKPQATGGRINGGFFVIDAKRIWEYLPEGDELNFEQESLKKLTKDKELMMYSYDGFWQPMDTYREYRLLNAHWEEARKQKNSLWQSQIRF